MNALIIDDFLDDVTLETLCTVYDQSAPSEWTLNDQVREHHYEHVFQSYNPRLPKPGEAYMARFERNVQLEEKSLVVQHARTELLNRLSSIYRLRLTKAALRCVRVLPGGFYRSHVDDYAGVIGATLYLNREWRWDWGGLLHMADQESPDALTTVFPECNRLVAMDNRVKVPHFVSTVAEYAQSPRYALIAFCSEG